MEDIAYIDSNPAQRVAMVLTAAAYSAVERNQGSRIEADLAAMTAIAAHVGVIASEGEELPPQFFVVRDSSPQRAFIGHWDTRLPDSTGSPATERYYWAADVAKQQPRSCERIGLIRMAHAMGARALTELSIGTWEDETTWARAYATGLLLAQKPLDPPPARGILQAITGEFAETLSGRSGKKLKLIEKVGSHNPAFTPPFVLHRNVKDQLRPS